MVAQDRPKRAPLLTGGTAHGNPPLKSKATIPLLAFILFVTIGRTSLQDPRLTKDPSDSLRYGLLIPASASMSRAWEIPRDPTLETLAPDSVLGKKIVHGFMLFMNTSKLAKRFAGGTMSCNNCHPNGGQREMAMPLVGVSSVFPEYNKRAGRLFTLEDRIIGCFLRSINATGSTRRGAAVKHENELTGATLSPQSDEVQSLATYIRWLSSNGPAVKGLPWRGQNTIPAAALIPVEKLRPKRGKQLFAEKCSACHADDGQGVDIGDKRAGPLWGTNSWNDGAGAARTQTLAGIIRYWMPYLDPGNLTDEEAQQIAAYITSRSRPAFPYQSKDYLKEKIPADAVYYRQLYTKNPLSAK